MSRLIFINFPVADLARATAFYEAIGATKNEMFSDATAACMVLSDTINVMLLTYEKFSQFTPKPIGDSEQFSSALYCMSADSRAEVDAIVEKAAAGGIVDVTPKQDHGFMYGRSFEDPDGNAWSVMWMDVEAARKELPAMQQKVA